MCVSQFVTADVCTYMYLCDVGVCVCVVALRGEEVNSCQNVFATGMVIMAVFNNCAL